MEEGKEITMANTNKYDKKGERERKIEIQQKNGGEAYWHINTHTLTQKHTHSHTHKQKHTYKRKT